MNIAIVVDGIIEQVGDIKTLFPHVSFPASGPEEEWLEENNVKAITYWKPYDLTISKLVPCEPYVEDGEVFAVVVEPHTEEEIQHRLNAQWARVRIMRNERLTNTDWVVTKSLESGTAVPQIWVEYRQDLRDITEQQDPFNIVWPELPSE